MLAAGGSLSCSGTDLRCPHQLGSTFVLLHHAPRCMAMTFVERRVSVFAV